MSKSSIYEKIEEKAQAEASLILEEAKIKAGEVSEKIISDANLKATDIINNINEKASDLLKSALTSNEQISKQELLAHKKELIHSVFVKVLEKLNSLDDESYTKFIVKLIKAENIKKNEVMFVNKEDFSRYNKLFSESSCDLAKLNKLLGLDCCLTLSTEVLDIKGGFILKNENFDVDDSFETLLKDLESTLESTIANILFNEAK